jgi:molecular chaperone GrpE
MNQEENIPNEQPEERLSAEETEQLFNDINNATGASDAEGLDPKDTEIASLKAQIEEQKDKYLRLFADFDNFKKRNAKERLELIQTAGKDVITGLLPVLDDFERALKATENMTEIAAAKEGMTLIHNKLYSYLNQKGLKPIQAIGETFDVEKHEALTEIPSPTPDMQGKVVDEIEKGYYLNDKIIRFAKVVVGKKNE